MEQALIASLAAVLGLVVGRYWDTRSEARRWRRDQRIRIYEQLAGAYYVSREAYRVLALTAPGTPDAEQAAAKALDLGVDFNRSVIAVWLHGSAEVASAAHQLDVEINKLFLTARSRVFSWDEWRRVRVPAEAAMERFTEAVRSELGLPHVPVTIRIADLGDPAPAPSP